MKILFFDIETTGLNFWQHGIHQISGCVDIDGVCVERFDFKVQPNPKAKIDLGALAVSNVTQEQVMAYTPMQQVHTQFTALLSKHVDKYTKTDKFFLVGFNNASFDNAFLRAWFVQNSDNYFGSWFWANPLDTYVLATQKLLKQRPEMLDFKLATVCKRMGITVDDTKLHDAAYDIELTRDLYYKVS